jgi:hypothetical protein
MAQPWVARPGQQQYWRRVQVPLYAFASYRAPAGQFIGPFSGAFGVTASTGPAGTGETWTVDLIQVQASAQFGAAPLVAQQIQAQQVGDTTTPPPPIIAQAWLAAGGTNIHLLGQTTSGGNDGIDVGGVDITPGERIAVVWYNVAGLQGPTGALPLWFIARGTKTVLTDQG